METIHLSHLTTQLEQIQTTEETMWHKENELSRLKKAIITLNSSTSNQRQSKNHISQLEAKWGGII